MVKSQNRGRLSLCAKSQTQPQVHLRRYGRRQLLKRKVRMGPKNCRRVLVEAQKVGSIEEGHGGEVDDEEAVGDSSSTDLNSKQDENNSSAREGLADNITIEVTDHRPNIDESDHQSIVGPMVAEPTPSNLDELPDEDSTTEDSCSLAPSEDDLYYIEEIKKSRAMKNARVSPSELANGSVSEGMLIDILLQQGTIEFLIKWKGYENKCDMTWEPEKTVINSAPGILKEYFSTIGGRDTIGRKRKRCRPTKAKRAGRGREISNAKKQKLEPELVMEHDKMVSGQGKFGIENEFLIEARSEDVEDREISMETSVLEETQARIADENNREYFINNPHRLNKALHLPSDSSDATFSGLDAAEMETLSENQASLGSLKPINEFPERPMSANGGKHADSHSDFLNPSGAQEYTSKENQGCTSSDGKVTAEGTARLRPRRRKTRQMSPSRVKNG